VPLSFRSVAPSELSRFEALVIDAFEPITWARKVDELYGPLNGKDWRERWRLRLANIFETQILLAGEVDGEPVAFASATLDSAAALGYIDLLAVGRRFQGKGYGRAMLRGMLRHLKEKGARYAHLDCMTTNEAGNNLYRSEGFTEVARHIRWFIRIP
jgi:ribosomal protein S18 acetylase RimI-like enzyme